MDLAGARKQTKKVRIVKFNRVLVDTNFLFGIFDRGDQYHEMAVDVLQSLRDRKRKLVLAWPVLYETVNTTFLENGYFSDFEKFLGLPDTELIDDKRYRNGVYELIRDDPRKFETSGLSLVDHVLCLMMKHSDDARIGGLVTFDKVLRDCGYRYRIEVVLPSNGQAHRDTGRLAERRGARGGRVRRGGISR